MQESRSNNVKSIIKAFNVLEALDQYGELSIAELSEQLAMDKATAHRIVNTIKDAGYVVQSPITKKYANSARIFELGENALKRLDLGTVVDPYMRKINRETNENVHLAVMSGTSVAYVKTVESHQMVRINTPSGSELPMYRTGAGKAILMTLPDEIVNEILDNTDMVAETPKTITNKEDLMKNLQIARARGYSEDIEESAIGAVCFGAPIFDYKGEVCAAITVALTSYRYAESKNKQLYPKLAVEAAAQISRDLGYIKP